MGAFPLTLEWPTLRDKAGEVSEFFLSFIWVSSHISVGIIISRYYPADLENTTKVSISKDTLSTLVGYSDTWTWPSWATRVSLHTFMILDLQAT